MIKTGSCRLSYPSLFEKNNLDDKYGCTLMIPKTDKKTVKAVKSAIEEAIEKGIDSKWNHKKPKNLWNPLRDGDEDADLDKNPEYEGMYYIHAKSGRKPIVLDETNEEVFSEEEVYAGCWVQALLDFFPFSSNGKNGVGAALGSVRKRRDDEAFGGGIRTADAARAAFGADDEEDEEDDF